MKSPFGRLGWTSTILISLFVGCSVIQIASRMPETNARRRWSQTKMDMHSLNTLLEAHAGKTNTLPGTQPMTDAAGDDPSLIEEIKLAHGENLGTYVSNFAPDHADPFSPDRTLPYVYHFEGERWMLSSAGPDLDYDLNPRIAIESNWNAASVELLLLTYDPTNGMTSNGDIYLTGAFNHATP